MALVVVAGVLLGKIATLLLCLVVGVLCIDEILVNFAKLKRQNFFYRYVVGFFILFFLFINIIFQAKFSRGFFTIAAIFLNSFLIFYLFKIPLKEGFMKNSAKKNPALLSTIVFLPLVSFGIFFESVYWKEVLSLLLLVTFSMDTGAWFFGKTFGKHKLWPAVSPNKTVEGFVGGILTSAIIGSLAWYFLLGNYLWYYSVIFGICGALSQVGDLVQSKVKREFGIKDSSNLIPGHGGVYDRIDSLIFLSPFFAIVVKYLGRHFPL
jgi:phosphatidate cytidylyltransferase